MLLLLIELQQPINHTVSTCAQFLIFSFFSSLLFSFSLILLHVVHDKKRYCWRELCVVEARQSVDNGLLSVFGRKGKEPSNEIINCRLRHFVVTSKWSFRWYASSFFIGLTRFSLQISFSPNIVEHSFMSRPRHIHFECLRTLNAIASNRFFFFQWKLPIKSTKLCSTTQSGCIIHPFRWPVAFHSHVYQRQWNFNFIQLPWLAGRLPVKIDKFPSNPKAERSGPTNGPNQNKINLNSKTVFLLFIFKQPSAMEVTKNSKVDQKTMVEYMNPLKVNRFVLFAFYASPSSTVRQSRHTHINIVNWNGRKHNFHFGRPNGVCRMCAWTRLNEWKEK